MGTPPTTNGVRRRATEIPKEVFVMTTDELIKDFLHKHFPGKSLKEYLALKVILLKFYEYLREKGELW